MRLGALVLALTPLLAMAAPDERMVARYGLNEAQFRSANDELLAKGLRLADLTVAEVGGERVIGAVWTIVSDEPDGSIPVQEKLAPSQVYLQMTRAELEASIKSRKAQESELDAVDAYDVAGTTWYAASFSPPKKAPLHTVLAFQTREQTTGLRQEAIEHGFDFYRLEIAPDGEDRLYFPVFVKRESPKQLTGLGATSAKGVVAASLEWNGLYPLSISAFARKDGKPQYYALLDDDSERELLLELPVEEFRAAIEPLVAEGALVVDIDSFVVDGVVKYSAVYVRHAR